MQLLCVDVSKSGGLGVCSAEDGKLWVWDTDTGETRVRMYAEFIGCISRANKIILSTYSET